MSEIRFNALVLKQNDKQLTPVIEQLGVDDLPQGNVLVQVEYSSINYKDAMAIGNRGIIRKFPAVPGIDLAGVVAESQDPAYKPGDRVVLTGWGIGERYWGGYSQYARVQSEWLTPLPAGLTTRQAMAIGTAGLTAMLCVLAIEKQGIKPDSGEILVTGATGGVGSVAVAILATLGYQVVAMSGKPEWEDRLKMLGAQRIVGRDEYATPSRPGRFVLESESLAAAVDTVGGNTLASIISRLNYGGCVAACGLVGGNDIDTNVFPFIVRGVSLLGIDSVRCPTPLRLEAWQRLARDLSLAKLDSLVREISLAQVPEEAAKLLAGQGQGRIVVNLAK